MTDTLNVDHSKWKKPRPLLSESLRPRALSDLTLPTPTIEGLQRIIESGSMVNLLFHGPIGSGKTSAAKIFMNAIGGCRTINRSSKTSPNLARYIRQFAGCVGANICFVDEAHLISKADQIALPDIIDWASRNCRFFFAATDIKKLIPTLRSIRVWVSKIGIRCDIYNCAVRLSLIETNEFQEQQIKENPYVFLEDDGALL
jgi:DNA polymerase III delta prime subunit